MSWQVKDKEVMLLVVVAMEVVVLLKQHLPEYSFTRLFFFFNLISCSIFISVLVFDCDYYELYTYFIYPAILLLLDRPHKDFLLFARFPCTEQLFNSFDIKPNPRMPKFIESWIVN